MARRTARPGRTLAVFFVVVVIVYGLVAAGGKWKPELGLDLQGGTQISMQAVNPNGGSISSDSLNEARDIIDQRVNGSGVTSAQVTTEGGDTIQVSIPGKTNDSLINRVRQTAKLRFRLVACDATLTACSASSSSSSSSLGGTSGSTSPRAPLTLGTKTATKSTAKSTAKTSSSATASASSVPVAKATTSASSSATASTGASAASSPSASASASAPANPQDDVSVSQAVSFMNSPPASWQSKYNSFSCPTPPKTYAVSPKKDVPGEPLITCDSTGQKYLLSPAVIEGSGISDANYTQDQNGTGYVVTLDFKSGASSAFSDATAAIAGGTKQFAIVLDGLVSSAPTADSRISGSAQIDGGSTPFSIDQAKALATNLKYGSLPLDFPQSKIQSEDVGPSLAGNQLTAGLWAGAIGLLLVMVFCLIYYRGLGLVVIGSLIVAGASTYGMVVLLSKTAGVTLDLPGIAGLIVAVGITADSFIVYFERIRDEMRDGKSMRVAVDAGWIRARNTCLAADSVSLLAAITLYIFASSDVRGFAFMLGLSTVIDLIIFFFFTHPVVKLLSAVRFFNRGHRLSGLSTQAVGGRVKRPATAGGRA
jgi:preprotein translocase subunit SecD